MASVDKNRNLVAAFSYLLFFVSGLVILFVEKHDKFIRFHAMQSVVLFGSIMVLTIVLGFVPDILVLGPILSLIDILLTILTLILWLVSIIRAYRGEMFKWPVVGDYAEKWARR